MYIKECKYCKKKIKTKFKLKCFCNVICQRKDYNRRPEVKEKNRLSTKEYRRKSGKIIKNNIRD